MNRKTWSMISCNIYSISSTQENDIWYENSMSVTILRIPVFRCCEPTICNKLPNQLSSHLLIDFRLPTIKGYSHQKCYHSNSLRSSDAIWWHRTGSILGLGWCFVTWWHQAIIWTNVDLSSVRYHVIHWQHYHKEIWRYLSVKEDWNGIFKITTTSHWDQNIKLLWPCEIY